MWHLTSRDVLMACETDQPSKVTPDSSDLSIQRPRPLLVPRAGLQGAPFGPHSQQPLPSCQKPEPFPPKCMEWKVSFGLWVVGTTRVICSSLLHADPCLLCNHRLQRAQTFTLNFSPTLSSGDERANQQKGVSSLNQGLLHSDIL